METMILIIFRMIDGMGNPYTLEVRQRRDLVIDYSYYMGWQRTTSRLI
jgi:hypothetical protein